MNSHTLFLSVEQVMLRIPVPRSERRLTSGHERRPVAASATLGDQHDLHDDYIKTPEPPEAQASEESSLGARRRKHNVNIDLLRQHFSLPVLRFHLFGAPLPRPQGSTAAANFAKSQLGNNSMPSEPDAHAEHHSFAGSDGPSTVQALSTKLSTMPPDLERRLLALFGSVQAMPYCSTIPEEQARMLQQREQQAQSRLDRIRSKLQQQRAEMARQIDEATTDPLRAWKSTASVRWTNGARKASAAAAERSQRPSGSKAPPSTARAQVRSHTSGKGRATVVQRMSAK